MANTSEQKNTPKTNLVWIAFSVLALASLGIGAQAYALNLGAAYHDAYCQDHRSNSSTAT